MPAFRSLVPVVLVASVSGVYAQLASPADPRTKAEHNVAALLARLGTPEAAYHATLLKNTPIASLADAETILALAATGDAGAQFAVWVCGIESGDKAPAGYLHDAAAQNDPDAVREIARLAYPGNPDETVRLLAPLAEKGDPDSCHRLGAIRLLRAKTPEESRAAIRLLEIAYGTGASPNSDSSYRQRNEIGPMLGAAWCDLPDASPEELATALKTYGKHLSPDLRTRLQLRTGKPDEAELLRSLRDKFSSRNVPQRGPSTPPIRRNPHLLALADTLPKPEKDMVAKAHALGFGDYADTLEESVGMMLLLLPVAERGETWAKSSINRIGSADLEKLSPELNARILAVKNAPSDTASKPSKLVLLSKLAWEMAGTSVGMTMLGSPPVITKFSDIHADLALLDSLPEATLIPALDDLAAKGDRSAILCHALVVPKTDPKYPEALISLKKLAAEGDTAACLALSTTEKDPAARLALLEKAAKDDNPFACERLTLELERQTPPDFGRAVAAARRINPDRNPHGLMVLLRLIHDHRELYASDAEYEAALEAAQKLRMKAMVARTTQSSPPSGLPSTYPYRMILEETAARNTAAIKAAAAEKQTVLDWLAAKSGAGSIDAALVLGDYLLSGERRKTEAAFVQLRQAAKLGSAEAALRLATDYWLQNLLSTDQKIDYLRQAAKGGLPAAYGHIASFEKSPAGERDEDHATAALAALEAGHSAGDFYCTMNLAKIRRGTATRSADRAKRTEGVLAAEKILLAAKPANDDDRKWLKLALIDLYLDERYPKDGKPLEKITALTPEEFVVAKASADKKNKIKPYEYPGPLANWRQKFRAHALLFARAQGSADAAYLLSQYYEYDVFADTGKTREEWLRIAADAGQPAAIVELSGLLGSSGKGLKKQSAELSSEREALIKKLIPIAEKNPEAAIRLALLYSGSGRNSEAAATMRRAAILGDGKAMRFCLEINLVSPKFAGNFRPDINEAHAWMVLLGEKYMKQNPESEEALKEQLAGIEKQPDYDAKKAHDAETAIREAMKRAGAGAAASAPDPKGN